MKDEWAIYQAASNSDEANAKRLQKEAGFAAHRCVCVFIDDDDPMIECGYHEQLKAKLAEIKKDNADLVDGIYGMIADREYFEKLAREGEVRGLERGKQIFFNYHREHAVNAINAEIARLREKGDR